MGDDLLLQAAKLVAARPIDLIDVAGIVHRQGARLDAGRVRT